jgi:hypothetical protein
MPTVADIEGESLRPCCDKLAFRANDHKVLACPYPPMRDMRILVASIWQMNIYKQLAPLLQSGLKTRDLSPLAPSGAGYTASISSI